MSDPKGVKNFAITGVAGYIAPRHLKAIQDTGNRLVAATDPHDAVGILDRFAFDVRFFTEFERFDRHLEKLRRGPEAGRVHYVSICSPNYLHDAHIRLALRVGAHPICEKPLVINPWNLDALEELEQETGCRVSTILQLRVHPDLIALRDRLVADRSSRRHRVCLTYITARGGWYSVSWKGREDRSGGIVTNIGIHFFDLLLWLFGDARSSEVHLRDADRAAGALELEHADVQWFLSTSAADLPFPPKPGVKTKYRSITVDGDEVEFSEEFADLHTRVYEEVLAGRGFGIADARPSVALTSAIRRAAVHPATHEAHPKMASYV
jgi:UDP-N-acetyl-2-amino-2-deoxyglucuronate dehydrogenase